MNNFKQIFSAFLFVLLLSTQTVGGQTPPASPRTTKVVEKILEDLVPLEHNLIVLLVCSIYPPREASSSEMEQVDDRILSALKTWSRARVCLGDLDDTYAHTHVTDVQTVQHIVAELIQSRSR
jgi:hypothetical protein